MISCLGPHIFAQTPIISIGTASGSVPVKTVQAVPFMPGFSSEDFMIWTGPALGGCRDGSPENRGNVGTAIHSSSAAAQNFMGLNGSDVSIVLCRRSRIDAGALAPQP